MNKFGLLWGFDELKRRLQERAVGGGELAAPVKCNGRSNQKNAEHDQQAALEYSWKPLPITTRAITVELYHILAHPRLEAHPL